MQAYFRRTQASLSRRVKEQQEGISPNNLRAIFRPLHGSFTPKRMEVLPKTRQVLQTATAQHGPRITKTFDLSIHSAPISLSQWVYRNAIKILNASAIKSKASTMAKPTYHTLPPSLGLPPESSSNRLHLTWQTKKRAAGGCSRNNYLWSPGSASAPITHILHFAAAFFLCLARVSGDVLWTISPVW